MPEMPRTPMYLIYFDIQIDIYRGIILKQYNSPGMVRFISFCELDQLLRDSAWSGYEKDPSSKRSYNICIYLLFYYLVNWDSFCLSRAYLAFNFGVKNTFSFCVSSQHDKIKLLYLTNLFHGRRILRPREVKWQGSGKHPNQFYSEKNFVLKKYFHIDDFSLALLSTTYIKE